ncbi:TetR/AcrR family transcriptional regulator [Lacticaseibacillus yichunensis]|uniref:TetR/AcrR family transcriptional regulator n=1 Tax=Lacticaseibacillus yichunensis TaxID=2486015 RepID=A0ABW4CM73_9LACO|nr:TetR-like C-terminal domain-containing protein [Lacticaseibacillus yichunensis]
MGVERNDTRYRKSREKLVNALFELLEKGADVNTLSVAELVAQAHVTRTTFYLHYEDRADFYDSVLHMMVDDLYRAAITEGYSVNGNSFPVLDLTAAFGFVAAHAKEYHYLLKDGQRLFDRKLLSNLYAAVERYCEVTGVPPRISEVPIDLIIEYEVMAIVGTAAHWLEEGMIYSPRYVAKTLAMLCQGGAQTATLADFFVAR